MKKWIVVEDGDWIVVKPLGERHDKILSSCSCKPKIAQGEDGRLIIVHNIHAKTNSREAKKR